MNTGNTGNTVAIFESQAFNQTEPQEHYINPCCFGDGHWYLVVERACGLFASLFGGRHRKVGSRGLAVLEAVLSGSDRVENLRWMSWKEFRTGGTRAA
jgi:hypothetical protein